MKAHSKTLVIGGGGGGIASALLASVRGEDVTLCEAHYALGGCASYFKRGQFVFDAGATTVSGVRPGEPLGDLFDLLGNSPKLKLADPGIVFHLSDGKIIRYHCDFSLWMDELNRHFPHLDHKPFWEKVFHINQEGWKVLRNIWHPRNVKLAPYLFVSTDLMLRRFNLEDPSYLELLNGILLISAQAHATKVPFLVGAMALAYPASCFAPVGGMKGLMDFFEQEMKKRSVDLQLKSRVQKIPANFDKVFSNVPVYKNDEGTWGALTLYFGVKSEIHELYHQVHVNGINYFVSFSIPGDKSRAPEGFQAVTISTHVDASYVRDNLIDQIMSDFLKRFPVSDVKHFTTGTPKTFERYTGRTSGFVGGIPLLLGQLPKLDTIFPGRNVFRVGDTVFPGQGLCGVVAGALLLHRHIVKKEL